MDHRCLYGHRVPSECNWAIQNRVCPICGASTVSLAGYQIARGLAQDISLDARAAFDVIHHLESRYELKAREATDEADEGAELGPEDLEIRSVAPPVTSSPTEGVEALSDTPDAGAASPAEPPSVAESDPEEAFFA